MIRSSLCIWVWNTTEVMCPSQGVPSRDEFCLFLVGDVRIKLLMKFPVQFLYFSFLSL